jgi:hypothetical protein
MAKTVAITPQIEEWIRGAMNDPEFDTSKVSVFEAYLVSTRPIQKRGSIFDKGRIQPGVLRAMAEWVANGNAVPIHTLHNDEMLPVGRAFYAQTEELDDGEYALRGLFYIDNSEEDLVQKVNNGTVDEVSVGLSTEKILCSECDFDFKGDEADIINILEQTCENGHTMGRDGAHVRMVGFDRWLETSLVSRGASQNSKILSRAKQALGKEERERLAANGVAPEATILVATSNIQEDDMANGKEGGGSEGRAASSDLNLNGLIDQVTDLKADNKAKDGKISDLEASVSKKDEEIATLKSERDDLQSKLENTDTEGLQAKLDETNKVVEQAHEKLKEHAHAALVASGHTEVDVSQKTVAELIEAIESTGLKLHQIAGAEGRSTEASSGDDDKNKKRQIASAFTTRK